MIFVNGLPNDHISALDRGLHYGDGVFETMTLRDGRLHLWERHWQRLQRSCERLHLPAPDKTLLEAELRQAVHQQQDGVLKLILTRGFGQRGYRLPVDAEPTRIISWSCAPQYPACYWRDGVTMQLCEMRLGRNAMLAGIKHLNRLEQVLARAEWDDEKIVEGLLLDSEGCVTEGVMSNIFWVNQGTLFTPDLSHCGVEGVMREEVMEQATQSGIEIETGHYNLHEVYKADELFLTNSLVGIWPVRDLDGTRFEARQPHSVMRQLQEKVQGHALKVHYEEVTF